MHTRSKSEASGLPSKRSSSYDNEPSKAVDKPEDHRMITGAFNWLKKISPLHTPKITPTEEKEAIWSSDEVEILERACGSTNTSPHARRKSSSLWSETPRTRTKSNEKNTISSRIRRKFAHRFSNTRSVENFKKGGPRSSSRKSSEDLLREAEGFEVKQTSPKSGVFSRNPPAPLDVAFDYKYGVSSVSTPMQSTRSSTSIQSVTRTRLVLIAVMRDEDAVLVFREFLQARGAEESLLFWKDLDELERILEEDIDADHPDTDYFLQRSQDVMDRYIEIDASTPINISGDTLIKLRHDWANRMNAEPEELLSYFESAKNEMCNILLSDLFRVFQASEEYSQLPLVFQQDFRTPTGRKTANF